MSAYSMSWDEAVDIPDAVASRLLKLASEREDRSREDLSRKITNNIGRMFFGDKLKTGSGNSTASSSSSEPERKTAYWSGGRTTTQPDLRPNPSRPRLKELQRMKPQPIDPFALGKFMGIDQSIGGKKTVVKKPVVKPGGQK